MSSFYCKAVANNNQTDGQIPSWYVNSTSGSGFNQTNNTKHTPVNMKGDVEQLMSEKNKEYIPEKETEIIFTRISDLTHIINDWVNQEIDSALIGVLVKLTGNLSLDVLEHAWLLAHRSDSKTTDELIHKAQNYIASWVIEGII